MFQKDEMKDKMDPGLISPLIVYLASDLAKEITKRTFFVGAGTIAEMRMVRTQGVTKTDDGGLWEPDEIAGKIDEILA